MPSTIGYAQALSERTISVAVMPVGAGSAFVRGVSGEPPIAVVASCSDIIRSGCFVSGQIKIASPAVSDGMSSSSGIKSSSFAYLTPLYYRLLRGQTKSATATGSSYRVRAATTARSDKSRYESNPDQKPSGNLVQSRRT